MIYKIYYAKLDLQGDIPCLEFKTWKQRKSFLIDRIIGNKDKVFLLAISYDSDKNIDSVYVFDSWWCIRFLEEKKYISPYYTFFLQEYSSYEEAYKVALTMKEVSSLCYSS